jgi:hypothetical protein
MIFGIITDIRSYKREKLLEEKRKQYIIDEEQDS